MKFFNEYYEDVIKSIQNLDKDKINSICELIKNTSDNGGTVYIAGNGGSASTASHISTDLTKNAKVKAMTFNDANLITCFSNDYGYENWLSAAVRYYVKPKDLVILLSVSGESKNLLNAANLCNKEKIKFVTITGAKKDNSLSKKTIDVAADEYRFTLDSIINNNAGLKERYQVEFNSAYNKATYYEVLSDITNNKKKQARLKLKKILTSRIEYFLLYLLLLSPVSNKFLLKILGR